uniref:Interferon-induced protein with tetratricopeptide repeats 9 n=1 Tax=Latimeria chalumnae TaxID=7897 RepID=H3A6S4_LATCH
MSHVHSSHKCFFLKLLLPSKTSTLAKDSLKTSLLELECHFTWNLKLENSDLEGLKGRLSEQNNFSLERNQVVSYGLLAFIHHLEGNNEETLINLGKSEEIVRKNFEQQFEKRILITYGNYAWVYYNMDKLQETKAYLDKIEAICKKFPHATRYSVQIPEVLGEKGWTLMKFSGTFYKESMQCFQKALEMDPNEVEWNSGYAIVLFRLEGFREEWLLRKQCNSVIYLKRVLELDPEDSMAMVLLGIKLAEKKQQVEAVKLVEKALEKSPSHPQILRYAAVFHRKHGSLESCLELLDKALRLTPSSSFVHHQIALCLKRKVQNTQTEADRNQLIKDCIFHLEKVKECQPSHHTAHIFLAEMFVMSQQYEKAEEIYNYLLDSERVSEIDKQQVHFDYGCLELYHKKCK